VLLLLPALLKRSLMGTAAGVDSGTVGVGREGVCPALEGSTQ